MLKMVSLRVHGHQGISNMYILCNIVPVLCMCLSYINSLNVPLSKVQLATLSSHKAHYYNVPYR